jgi:hypothetical protein
VVENAFAKSRESLQSQQVLLEDTESAHEKAITALQGTHTAERDRAVALLSQLRAEQVREVSGLKSQHEENVRTALEFQKERLSSEFKGVCRIFILPITCSHCAVLLLLLWWCDRLIDVTVRLVGGFTVTTASSF